MAPRKAGVLKRGISISGAHTGNDKAFDGRLRSGAGVGELFEVLKARCALKYSRSVPRDTATRHQAYILAANLPMARDDCRRCERSPSSHVRQPSPVSRFKASGQRVFSVRPDGRRAVVPPETGLYPG